MKAADLLKRTPVRLAAAFTLLFALTALSLGAALTLSLTTQLEDTVRRRVAEVRDALVAVDRDSGFRELADVVGEEAGSIRDADTILLLLGSDGTVEAGNVRDIARFEGWRVLARSSLPDVAATGDPDDRFFALWTPVSGGSLLVGVSDGEIGEARRISIRAFGWGLLFSAALAAASGILLARRAQRKIDAVAGTLSAVAGGAIGRRVPLSGSGDDLDHVASQLNRTLDQLQRLITNVNQTSSDIAHDLKKPLGRLRRRLERTVEGNGDLSATRHNIRSALGDIDGIAGTFEALLRIADIEAGARRARFTAVDLGAVLTDLAEIYEAVAADAGHDFRFDSSSPESAVVHGDRELLTQLFANLIENAIRHCPPPASIALRLMAANDTFEVHVADGGPGIPEHERDNVFRRLYRLERERSSEGSGLGLSLVAAIAELHGATVRLSDNDPGLIAAVSFPRSREPIFTKA